MPIVCADVGVIPIIIITISFPNRRLRIGVVRLFVFVVLKRGVRVRVIILDSHRQRRAVSHVTVGFRRRELIADRKNFDRGIHRSKVHAAPGCVSVIKVYAFVLCLFIVYQKADIRLICLAFGNRKGHRILRKPEPAGSAFDQRGFGIRGILAVQFLISVRIKRIISRIGSGVGSGRFVIIVKILHRCVIR